MADEAIRGKNYVSSNRFYIEMESTIKASFSECSSIGIDIESTPHREGGVNDQVRLMLGEPKFTPVTLKRGITNDLTFWEWLKNILDPTKKVERRNVNIVVFNQAGETMQCWTLLGAVPTGWKTPAMQASQNEIAVEELTLGFEGLQVSDQNSDGAQVHSQGRDSMGYFTAG
ncbi:MAG: phage tail protein [Synechococcales bacterium]|nr:phage tail protein [Synechococcales bacterium]